MHTSVEILLTGLSQQQGQQTLESLCEDILAWEKTFNRFDMRGELAVVNARAKHASVDLSDTLFMALELCEVFRRATKGYFSVAAASAAKLQGARAYELDAQTHQVRFLSSDVALDLGGFAKGFALDEVRQRAERSGAQSGLINFGNSSVAAIAHHPYGECWSVGVEHPFSHNLACEVALNSSSMSLSGRTPSGEYHIVNPLTGERVACDDMILVEGRSALVCEVLSTALYAAPEHLRHDILLGFEGYSASSIRCTKSGGVERTMI